MSDDPARKGPAVVSPTLTARIDSQNGVGTVALSGELDLNTVPVFESQLALFENEGVATIMVDLRDLVFTDSTGLRALLSAKRRVTIRGRHLIFVGARPRVRRAFQLTGTEVLLDDRDAESVFHRFAVDMTHTEGEVADAGSRS
jgi:anti-sigma B factor antagonist